MVRFKNRYLILGVSPRDGRPSEGIGAALREAIRAAVELQHGPAFLEAVSPSLQVHFYHHLAGVAIVRVGRSEHRKVLQSCLRLSLVDYKGVAVTLLKLTGTFRVAKRAAREHVARIMAGQPPLSREHAAAAAALQEKLDALFT